MLHQKADRISAFTATKAFIYFLCRRNSERGCPFIMEWTKTKVIGPPFFQFYKTANRIDNINTAENLLYSILGNQNINIGATNIAKTFEVLLNIKLLNPKYQSLNLMAIPIKNLSWYLIFMNFPGSCRF